MAVDTQPFLLAGLFATLCLLCGSLALIDLRRGIIPDALNLVLCGLGLAKAVITGGAAAGVGAIAEAIAVGAIFWLFRRLYFAVRKIQGLGLGDVKFLAAAAPWVGMTGIPMLLLVAALSALLVIGSAQLAGQGLTRQSSFPFGPFLGLGLLSTVAAQEWFGLI
ncbi:MAG: prepilin peptidase [Bradyrhizobium sp.]|nr:prepilin peptidase [Bradyrhizobium sp.]